MESRSKISSTTSETDLHHYGTPSVSTVTASEESPPERNYEKEFFMSPLDFMDHFLHPSSTRDMDDALSVAAKRRGLYNSGHVLFLLEGLLTLGQFICLDEFLSLFTFLPLRVLLFLLRCPYLVYSRKVSSTDIIDVLHLCLLLTTTASLVTVDTSWLYHQIRGQSVIKLYVMFNVIEMFDRLCSSFGVDILDSLGFSITTMFSFPSQLHFSRMVFDLLVSQIYLVLHAALLLAWLVTLNVAINTKNNALLTLLVSNNFVELKGALFKSFKIQNLFQIGCADSVERFQLSVFLVIIVMVTKSTKHLFMVWTVIYCSEVIIDWIKHSFITKFNHIPPPFYKNFVRVLCEDITKPRPAARSLGGSSVSKRIGFVSVPLAALCIRMADWDVWWFWVGVWIALVGFKISVSIGLMGFAWNRCRSKSGEWVRKLMGVERYDVVAKS